MNRRAKIIATLGPASDDKSIIKELLIAGMDVARINFSHGDHQGHAQVIKNLREAAQELDHPVTILQDLSGPKIRTGMLTAGPVELVQGKELILTTEEGDTSGGLIPVNFADLALSVEVGGRILLDDGRLELVVKNIQGNHIQTEIIQGGILKSRKGINLPGAKLNIDSLTKKDLVDLEFGLSNDIDVLALSFVRSADDIERLRQEILRINPEKKKLPIIAKL